MRVSPGIDQLLDGEVSSQVKGAAIGLLASASVTPDLRHDLDALLAAGFRVVSVFGPEHGFRSTTQAAESESSTVDADTGTPVVDTYRREPAEIADHVRAAGVELLLIDLQDVGARFYTYVWSMYDMLVAAGLAGVPVLVSTGPIRGRRHRGRADARRGVRLVRRTCARPAAARYDHRRTGPPLRRSDRGRAGRCRADARVATGDAVRRHRARVGSSVTEHPHRPHRRVLSRYRSDRGHQPVRGQGDDDAVRGSRRALAGRAPRPLDRRAGTAGGGGAADHLRSGVLQARRDTGARPPPSRHRSPAIRPVHTAVAILTTVRRCRPDDFAWRTPFCDKLAGSAALRESIDAGADTTDITASWEDPLNAFRALPRALFALWKRCSTSDLMT